MRRLLRLRVLVKELRPIGTTLASNVLCSLSEQDPLIRALVPEEPEVLCRRFYATFEQIILRGDRFHTLEVPLADLGRRAAAAGITGSRLCRIRDEVLRTIRDFAGDSWTDDDYAALGTLLDAAVGAMLAGAERRHAA